MEDFHPANGFTRIPNELLDALTRTRIPGQARQVFDCILRKTFGYNKTSDSIPLSQIQASTGLPKNKVIRARNLLQSMNIITVTQNGNGGPQKGTTLPTTYCIQIKYEEWKPFPKKGPSPKKGTPIPQNGNGRVPKRGHSKDNPKDNVSKNNIYTAFDKLWEKYPCKVGKKQARRHFLASVRTAQDCQDVKTALENYLASRRVRQGYIQNGSRWFAGWTDWVEYSEPESKEDYDDRVLREMGVRLG